MSENKYEPPKKLRHGVYPFDVMTEYVRADLVDGLVEALESCRVETKTYGDQGYVFTQHFDEQKVIAALAALKEET